MKTKLKWNIHIVKEVSEHENRTVLHLKAEGDANAL